MGEYELYYGTIGETFTQIAKGHSEHDYALIPEETYDSWRSLSSFSHETVEFLIGEDDAWRTFAEMHFSEEDHNWTIVTIRRKHPKRPPNERWRFIVSILKDGKEISCSKVTIEQFDVLYTKQDKDQDHEEKKNFLTRLFSRGAR